MLSWTFYHLAAQPDIQLKLQDELNRVFGHETEAASQVTADPTILSQLTYTNAVLKETLRMYPPAAAVRKPPRDYTVCYKEQTYAHGPPLFFLINHYAMHRHPGGSRPQ